jgi:hypothetical protein
MNTREMRVLDPDSLRAALKAAAKREKLAPGKQARKTPDNRAALAGCQELETSGAGNSGS